MEYGLEYRVRRIKDDDGGNDFYLLCSRTMNSDLGTSSFKRDTNSEVKTHEYDSYRRRLVESRLGHLVIVKDGDKRNETCKHQDRLRCRSADSELVTASFQERILHKKQKFTRMISATPTAVVWWVRGWVI